MSFQIFFIWGIFFNNIFCKQICKYNVMKKKYEEKPKK